MSSLVPSSSKVLVTGASGFVAIHSIKAFLEAGFFVRGTVRSASKGEYLKKLYEGLGYTGKFEYAIVGDIGKPGAFDDAVKGIDAIKHVASPVVFTFDTPDDVIKPAVDGTLGVLESVRNYGPSVKRVVIVSSAVAVESGQAAPYIYTENNWNEESLEKVKSLGKAASGLDVYTASKVLAERAAWDYMKKHKEELNFDLTVVCPPWVWGPLLQDISSFEQINESVQFLLTVWKTPKTNDELAQRFSSYVDVRDFARLSADLLVAEKARNERVILSGGEYSIQDIIDNLSALPDVPTGNPGATKGKVHDVRLSSEKVQSILGKPAEKLFRPLEETIKATVQSCLDRGLLTGVKVATA